LIGEFRGAPPVATQDNPKKKPGALAEWTLEDEPVVIEDKAARQGRECDQDGDGDGQPGEAIRSRTVPRLITHHAALRLPLADTR
jgi:hypothetical protein